MRAQGRDQVEEEGQGLAETPGPWLRLSLGIYLGAADSPDIPTVTTTDVSFISGFNLTVSCSTACNPLAQYSLMINGNLGPAVQQLFLATIHLGTAGVYTCEAINPAIGNHSATDTLIILPGERESLEGTLLTNWILGSLGRPLTSTPGHSTEIEGMW